MSWMVAEHETRRKSAPQPSKRTAEHEYFSTWLLEFAPQRPPPTHPHPRPGEEGIQALELFGPLIEAELINGEHPLLTAIPAPALGHAVCPTVYAALAQHLLLLFLATTGRLSPAEGNLIRINGPATFHIPQVLPHAFIDRHCASVCERLSCMRVYSNTSRSTGARHPAFSLKTETFRLQGEPLTSRFEQARLRAREPRY